MVKSFIVSLLKSIFIFSKNAIGSICSDIASSSIKNVINKFNQKNKLQVFCLFTKLKWSDGKRGNGYYFNADTGESVLCISININIINNYDVNKIMRDINLFAYYEGNEVCKFDAGAEAISGTTNKSTILADEKFYTTTINSKSVKNLELEFILEKDKLPKSANAFDEIKFGYFDENNKSHKMHLIDVNPLKCWIKEEIDVPSEKIKIV